MPHAPARCSTGAATACRRTCKPCSSPPQPTASFRAAPTIARATSWRRSWWIRHRFARADRVTTLSSALAPWRARVLAVAERRLPALTRLKQPEALPIRLHRHRIYVLPTRFGLMFSAVLLVMLMGALNYNNNPALLLTCLLGAACYQSVFQAFRCINGVQLVSMRGRPCHAGEPLHIDLSLRADGRPRRSLRLRAADQETVFDIDGGDGHVRISAPTALRGWCRVGRIRLYSEYPFGLFQ